VKYSGILRIGFKLLVNDKGKFSALLIGITFAVFLMMQMTAMFAGIMNRAFSTVTNIGAAMWVMDPAVNTASSAIPVPDYLLDAVRSMDGVSYAVPLFIGGAMVKLEDGTFQSVSVVGLGSSRVTSRRSTTTTRSSRSTTPSSRNWRTRRSARPSSSTTTAAPSWASPGSPRTG
jgi:putative ABC transport system permease protein